MAPGRFRFERFLLDVSDRQLRRDGAPVELNGRYLDALALLVREQGRLVSKERFHDEVWRGVPVTDEALTQCIRTLRRQLGDDAGRPRFIETVPKHGYRFIAAVERDETGAAPSAPILADSPGRPSAASHPYSPTQFGLLGGAGMAGGGVAGALIGLFYGFGAAPEPLQAGMGAASVLLVLVWAGVSPAFPAAVVPAARAGLLVVACSGFGRGVGCVVAARSGRAAERNLPLSEAAAAGIRLVVPCALNALVLGAASVLAGIAVQGPAWAHLATGLASGAPARI